MNPDQKGSDVLFRPEGHQEQKRNLLRANPENNIVMHENNTYFNIPSSSVMWSGGYTALAAWQAA